MALFNAANAQTIAWFYTAAFGRTPVPNSTLPDNGDISGITFWTDAYLGGNPDLPQFSLESYEDPADAVFAIADFFVASAEFQARYPDSLTNDQFVLALYENMLNRTPDVAGLQFWVDELSGGASRGEVLARFANTPENQAEVPDRAAALESFIVFIAADTDNTITPDEAGTWLVANPTLDAAVVDLGTDTTAPVVEADQAVTYSEGSTADATLLTVVAADEVGGSGLESFAIATGNDMGYFEIDADGDISLTTKGAAAGTASNSATVDPDVFTLGVTATDRAGNTSTAVDVVLTVADITPPAVSSALVGPTSVILAYSETLNSSKLPVPTDFAVTQNGTTAISVNSVTISGSSVTLALATAPTGTITVSYTPNADVNRQLQDPSGNVAAALTNQAAQADTTAPTLVSSVPSDGATNVAVGSNLVLTFSETVKAGTGNIVITNTNNAADNRTITVTDTSQVTFSGSTVTINPTADLNASASYVVTMNSGVVTDLVGNAFAGLSGTQLDFSTPGGATTGQAFALTIGADTIPGLIGSLGTTNTDGNDTIGGVNNATSNQFSAVDNIDAGLGTDTLNLELNASYGGGAPIKNVEILSITSTVSDAIAAVGGTFNLTGITGLTTVQNSGSANNATGGNDVQTFSNIASAANISVRNTDGDTTAVYADTAVAGSADSVRLILNTVGQANANAVNLNNTTTLTGSTGIETLTIEAAGPVGTSANTVTVNTNATQSLTKVTFAGSSAANITLGTNITTTATTLDASTMTGALTLAGLGVATHTVTGGSGNDSFNFAANYTTADVVNGGAGTDTLGANGAQLAAVTTKTANVTNIETIRVVDDIGANATINLANFGASNVRIAAQTGVETLTINNIATGGNVRFDGATVAATVTLNVKDATLPGTADTITLDLRGGAVTYNATMDGVETVNVNLSNATGAATLALTDAAMTTFNVINTAAQAFTSGTLGASVSKVDLSGVTGTGINTIFMTAAASTGVSLTGSGNADTVTATNNVDVINAGAGNDSITGLNSGDIINVGAGTDTILMTAAGQTFSGATIASGITALTGIDQVTGMAAGDIIDLSGISNTFAGAAGTTIASATGTTVALVRGTFNTTTSIFTAGETGADTLFVYDADGAGAGTVVESIALIGTAGVTGTAAAGVLTLA